VVCAALPLLAQAPSAAMQEALKKQRESIDKQRAAVQKQIQAAGQAARPTSSFFTAPWTPPPEPIAPPPPVVAPASTAPCDPVPAEQIGALVSDASLREGLSPDLLRAVIDRESRGIPCAVSSKGAMGLMQLMPETAAHLGVADPFDPQENVDAGAHYLKRLLSRYEGDVPLALAAYNAGPTRVDTAGGIPRIPETMQYISAILGQIGAR
jgi:soluble lytic murein transglycosylase-like protein